jgi:hypothetical protein
MAVVGVGVGMAGIGVGVGMIAVVGLGVGVGTARVGIIEVGVGTILLELVAVGVIVCVVGVTSGMVVGEGVRLDVSSAGDIVRVVPVFWFVLPHALTLRRTIIMTRRDKVLLQTCFFNVLNMPFIK